MSLFKTRRLFYLVTFFVTFIMTIYSCPVYGEASGVNYSDDPGLSNVDTSDDAESYSEANDSDSLLTNESDHIDSSTYKESHLLTGEAIKPQDESIASPEEIVTPQDGITSSDEIITVLDDTITSDEIITSPEDTITSNEIITVPDEILTSDETLEFQGDLNALSDEIIEFQDESILATTSSTVTPGITRISGETAVETAIEVAKNLKEELGVSAFGSILVARSDHYADALSGSYLAVKKSAPILLVRQETSKAAITRNQTVFDYIKNNLKKNGTIYVLGGTAAVSDSISNKLSQIGEVKRLAGDNALLTNLEILKEAGIEGEDLVVATATNYPDALAASSLGKPILLVKGNNLREEQKVFLEGHVLGITYQPEPKLEPEPEPAAGADVDTESSKTSAQQDSSAESTEQKTASEENANESTEQQAASEENANESTEQQAASETNTSEAEEEKPVKLVPVQTGTKYNINIYIMGGTAAVSKDIEEALSTFGKVDRVYGDNKYGTAIAIADRFYAITQKTGLATGDSYHDALVGGPLGYARMFPIILSSKGSGFEHSYKYIYTSKTIKHVTIFGGASAVSDDAAAMDTKGTKKSGFLDVGGNRYYAKSNGDLNKNTLFTVSGNTYGATSKGVLAKNGWTKIDKYTYLFKDYEMTKECLAAKKVLDSVGYTLWNAFVWARDIPYIAVPGKYPALGATWFANYAFTNRRGNCYVKTSALYFMSKILNYNPAIIYGNVELGGHSWIQMNENGKYYLYDLTVHLAHGISGWQIWYTTPGGYTYYGPQRVMSE